MKKLFKVTLLTEADGVVLELAPFKAENHDEAFGLVLSRAASDESLRRFFPVEGGWDVTVNVEVVTD